ncbi:helix-turn-helix domain-containing protein [Streptomyces parvulus]|uniref:helix-turn-helix domain-containing protein n=1 Tax=Streptomyces parvulus TaxID=146923 RepID=UPI001CF94D8D|nr:helix-turn-helix domain-containing protein [Streptomyces parvulus]
MPDLMQAVDALVERALPLPPPGVRASLRKADDLTQEDVAIALGVTRVAFNRWEVGAAKPRPRHLAAYAHLLRRLAAKHPDAADGYDFTKVS